jgi:hypothetical protein
MLSAIISHSEMFRAERLFSEGVSNPISNNPYFKPQSASTKLNQGHSAFNKCISRSLKDITKYCVIEI